MRPCNLRLNESHGTVPVEDLYLDRIVWKVLAMGLLAHILSPPLA